MIHRYQPFDSEDWVWPAEVSEKIKAGRKAAAKAKRKYLQENPDGDCFSPEFVGFDTAAELADFETAFDWNNFEFSIDCRSAQASISNQEAVQVQFTQAEILGHILENKKADGTPVSSSAQSPTVAPQTTTVVQAQNNVQDKTLKYLAMESYFKTSKIESIVRKIFDCSMYEMNLYPSTLVPPSVITSITLTEEDEEDLGIDHQVVIQCFCDLLAFGTNIDNTNYDIFCKFDPQLLALLKDRSVVIGAKGSVHFANLWSRVDTFLSILHEINFIQQLLSSTRYSEDSNHANTNWLLYGISILDGTGFVKFYQSWETAYDDNTIRNVDFAQAIQYDIKCARKGASFVVLRQIRYCCERLISILKHEQLGPRTIVEVIETIKEMYHCNANMNWRELHELISIPSLYTNKIGGKDTHEYFDSLTNVIGTIARGVTDLARLGTLEISKLNNETEYIILEMWSVFVAAAITTINEAILCVEAEIDLISSSITELIDDYEHNYCMYNIFNINLMFVSYSA